MLVEENTETVEEDSEMVEENTETAEEDSEMVEEDTEIETEGVVVGLVVTKVATATDMVELVVVEEETTVVTGKMMEDLVETENDEPVIQNLLRMMNVGLALSCSQELYQLLLMLKRAVPAPVYLERENHVMKNYLRNDGNSTEEEIEHKLTVFA